MRGYDVYLVDVRGYGHSTRPPEMSQPPEANKPIVSTKVAAHDLGAAVDYILKKRKVAKINVMGWSWGTSIAGSYTSEHNDKVSKLVLYAPQWIRNEPAAPPRDAARRLPAGVEGFREGALAEGRRGRQAGRSDSARRVRGLGFGDLGDRSGSLQSTIRRCCARPMA